MRVMVKFRFPTVNGNEGLKSGRIAKLLPQLLEDLKPEAAYFYAENGMRAGFFVINMTDSSQIIDIGERLWFAMGGDVEMTPVMNPDDIQKGLPQIPSILAKYA